MDLTFFLVPDSCRTTNRNGIFISADVIEDTIEPNIAARFLQFSFYGFGFFHFV